MKKWEGQDGEKDADFALYARREGRVQCGCGGGGGKARPSQKGAGRSPCGWVWTELSGVAVLCIPILRPRLSPWSLLHTMVRNRHRRTHSVYCPMPSLNVYIDKHHRGNQVSLAGTTQRMGQEAPPTSQHPPDAWSGLELT